MTILDPTTQELAEELIRAHQRLATLEKIKRELEDDIDKRDAQLERDEIKIDADLNGIHNRSRNLTLQLQTLVFRTKQAIRYIQASAKQEDMDKLKLALERLNPNGLVTEEQALQIIRQELKTLGAIKK